MQTYDVAAATAVLGCRAEDVGADRLLVRTDDPAGLNAQLVRAGVPVEGLAPERRTLEDAVLELTSTGSDRVA